METSGGLLEDNRLNGIQELRLNVLSVFTGDADGLPRADRLGDAKGFFIKDGEVFGTIYVWVKFFFGNDSYLKSVRGIFCRRFGDGIDGWDGAGNLRQKAFYSETQAKTICLEILNTPQANTEGCFILGSKEYCHSAALADLFGVDKTTMLNRLKGSGIKGVSGRVFNKNILPNGFYPIDDVVEYVCPDFLENLPQLGLDGFTVIDEVAFGCIKSFERLLGVSKNTIISKVKQAGLKAVRGRDICGRITDIYPKEEIIAYLNSFGKPRVDANGVVVIEDVAYYTYDGLVKVLGVSRNTIKRAFKKKAPPYREALDTQSKVIRVYPLVEGLKKDVALRAISVFKSKYPNEKAVSGFVGYLQKWKPIFENELSRYFRVDRSVIENKWVRLLSVVQRLIDNPYDPATPFHPDKSTQMENIKCFARILGINESILGQFFFELSILFKEFKQD